MFAGTRLAYTRANMPSLDTKYFGTIEYDNSSVFHFPLGLPGFENERRFIPMEVPDNAPLIFLQSVRTQDLCFLAFPILVVDREYCLTIAPDDLALLELDEKVQPRIGEDVLVLGPLCVQHDSPVTANLMAPIVVNVRTRRAVQAVRHDFAYSHQHPVTSLAKAELC